MFRLPAAIAVGVHVAIIGWLTGRYIDQPVVPRRVAPRTVSVATAAMDVTLYTVPAPAREVAREGNVGRGTTARVATRPAGAPEAEPAASPGTNDAEPAVAEPQIDLAMSPKGWDALDHVPAGTDARAPTRPAPATPVEHETFAMDIDRDGTAHLRDKRNLRLVLPTKQELGQALFGHERADQDGLRPTDGPPTMTVPSIGVTIAKFDITDFAMRMHGDDPYASEKLHVLDATRDERAEIGAKHQRDQLARAGQLVQANLDGLWDTIRDPAARKRALFELWDECAETGSQDLVVAGASARARVVKLVRARLPQGAPDAFTAAELDALNQHRQSRAVFAPYEPR